MCGRFALNDDGTAVQAHFHLPETPLLAPRYNIPPTQPIAALGLNRDGQLALTHFQWGLIPSWAKDPRIGQKMINARAETVAEKPSFRSAFQRRRCLIPMSGFYEWQKLPDGSKQPYYIHPVGGDNALFAVAGLWERWHSPDGGELLTCTLLTTEANSLMAPLHQRMPLILPPAAYDLWLTGDVPAVASLLRPYPPDQMAAYPVSQLVNSPRHDVPECLTRLS
jgi:putative SOS response-associated peptidase YedK